MKEKFLVTGMTCSACSAGIERYLKNKEGVFSANVSLMGESMMVEYDEKKISTKEIIQIVQDLGYGASVYDENILKQKEPQPKALKKRFLLSRSLQPSY